MSRVLAITNVTLDGVMQAPAAPTRIAAAASRTAAGPRPMPPCSTSAEAWRKPGPCSWPANRRGLPCCLAPA